MTDLELLLAELEAACLDADALRSGIEELDLPALILRASQARSALEGHRLGLAAAARRNAVLIELSKLGYDVAEGMATSMAQSGQLVLRCATRPDYGVELSAAGTGERFQMRPVAFEAIGRGPDRASDRDAETIWCDEVSTMQRRLAELGGGLIIEKALPIGATSLKRIMIDADRHVSAKAPVLGKRTLG